MERSFGPYIIDVVKNHCIIRREDNLPVDPTFYELQHMKCMAFGAPVVAVEVFPSSEDLVDGQNQRHLWKVDKSNIPNLKTGYLCEIDVE
jgi:hypothetical protein